MAIAILIGIVATAVFIGSTLNVALVKRVVESNGWVARPRADRWHSKPTALHGGVGFIGPFLVGVTCVYYIFVKSDRFIYANGPLFTLFSGYIGTCVAMFAVGLMDDIYHFKPRLKMALQIAALSMFVSSGGVWAITGSHLINICFTMFWLVGIVNAVNLLDNMDGVSSGVVMIGATGVALLGFFGGGGAIPVSVGIGLCLCAAIAGFWIYNKPPASIFMGDSGSLFIGFGFAGITIPSSLNNNFNVPVTEVSRFGPAFIAVTIAAIPILDTSLVTATRLWRGESPATGGRDHSTHRLVRFGLTGTQTMLVMYVMAGGCVISAVAMQRLPAIAPLLFCILAVSFLLTALYLSNITIEGVANGQVPGSQLLNRITQRVPVVKAFIDIPIAILALYAAYLIRFDFAVPPQSSQAALVTVPAAVAGVVGANVMLGVYRVSLRTPGGSDLLRFVAYTALAVALTISILVGFTRFEMGHSRGALVIFTMLLFIGTVGIRFSFRFIDEVLLRLRPPGGGASGRLSIYIYGTGRASRLLYNQVSEPPVSHQYKVAGFVEDYRVRTGERFCGCPIVTMEQMSQNAMDDGGIEVWVAGQLCETPDFLAFRRACGPRCKIKRTDFVVSEV